MNARASNENDEGVDNSLQIESLLSAARADDFGNRRNTERHPFFYPVSVTITRLGTQSFSAFSRDISAGGMGLLHNMPFEPGPVWLTIINGADGATRIPGEVMWCVPCGEGWYTSGVQFTTAELS